VQLDAVTITAHDAGAAESHADSHLLASADGTQPLAFIGDLAFHGTHPYTNDGHTGSWLSTLDNVGNDLSAVRLLLPGHGAPSGPALFAEQRRYLMFYREMVRRLAQGAPKLTDDAKAHLETELVRFLPGAPLTWMIQPGADAVAAELAGTGTAHE
jgi:hypothetical protein